MVEPNEFNEAKNALLRHFSSQQTSHGALIIGFTVSVFTLLQVVQNATRLSSFFSAPFQIELAPNLAGFKFWILFFSISFLISLLIYSFFRFIVYGYFSSAIIGVKADDKMEEPIHDRIVDACWNSIKNKKLLLIFPMMWFATRGEEGNVWKGRMFSFIFAFLPSLFILFLSW